MTRGITLMASAILLFTSISPVQASTPADPGFSSVQLYNLCASKYDTDYGYCAGYVSAIANILLNETVGGFRACNLGIVRSQQFVDIFKAYAAREQQNLPADANVAVAASLAQAFPCQ